MIQFFRNLLLFSFLIFSVCCNAQTTTDLSKEVIKSTNDIRNKWPREKIYVQTDRSIYLPGDTIWFKGYLINGFDHQYSDLSKIIYFELIDNKNEIVERMALPVSDGMAWSGFPIKDTYSAGIHTIRAYTNWMRNFEESLFFSKIINIVDREITQNTAAIPLFDERASKTRSSTPNLTLEITNDLKADSVRFIIKGNLKDKTRLLFSCQSRGGIYAVANFTFNGGIKIINLARGAFPTGICEATVMDTMQTPLLQKAFFINHHDELRIDMQEQVNKEFYSNDSIPIILSVTNKVGEPVSGSFSVSITDNRVVQKDALGEQNILSYLMLSSDIKGNVKNPSYYFNSNNLQVNEELSQFINRSGWVNYKWDTTKKIIFKPENDFEITGKVFNFLKGAPHAKVTLLGGGHNVFYKETITNSLGEFTFHSFPELYDATFIIRALNDKNRKGSLTLSLNEFTSPPVPSRTYSLIKNDEIKADTIIKNLISSQDKMLFQSKNGIALKAVDIVGKKVIKGSKNLNGPGNADQTITTLELTKEGRKPLLQLLYEKVSGLTTGYLRKEGVYEFLLRSRKVKFIIDGQDIDVGYKGEPSDLSTDHLNYIESYLKNFTAIDIVGIEIMENMKFNNSYTRTFLSIDQQRALNIVTNKNNFIFMEITTKGGNGPHLEGNIYTYKPITYGLIRLPQNNRVKESLAYRPTLYWNPNVITNAEGKATILFYSSDRKGEYTLSIEGTDLQGNFGAKSFQLKIN